VKRCHGGSVFYVSDDMLNLYLVSGEKSRHSQNLNA
jgi:hypothetical protein